MNFLLGLGLGALVTLGVKFIFSSDEEDIDENEEDWYT